MPLIPLAFTRARLASHESSVSESFATEASGVGLVADKEDSIASVSSAHI